MRYLDSFSKNHTPSENDMQAISANLSPKFPLTHPTDLTMEFEMQTSRIDVPSPVETLLPEPSVDLVRAALRSDALPPEWSTADIERAVLRYRRFLGLVQEAPSRPVAPTRDIDFIWHLHMLSPRAYFADCQRLFGDILDHDGGFGKESTELPILLRCFEQTSRRYESRYGVPYVESQGCGMEATNCWHDCVGRCWHACASEAGDTVEAQALAA